MNYSKASHQSGFTLIEILIVIVIIAILSVISIVAYNGIQNRARASEASSALTQAAKKIKVWQVENSGITPPDLAAVGVADNGNVTYQYKPGTTPGSYCITATSGTVSYKITENTQPAQGGCAGHGVGGVSAVTNLATDPRATTLSSTLGWITGRWHGSGGSGTYATVSNASDGPNGIASYARKTWSAPPSSMASSGDTGFNNTNARMIVSEGDTYFISCYLRPSVVRNVQVGVYQYTSSGSAGVPARLYGAGTTASPNQWVRITYSYTVPSGVGQISIVCDSAANTTGGAVNWAIGSTLDGTGLMIVKASGEYGYADGTSSNWDWNGTPNSSTSTGPAL